MSLEHKPSRCRQDESGSILITVVWMTVVLSLVAVTFSSQLMSELSLVQRLEGDLKAYTLLQSGAEYAKSEIAQDEFPAYDSCKEGWCNDTAQFKSVAMGDGSFTLVNRVKEGLLSPAETRYGLADESGKLNLNTATPKELERLFEQTLPAKKKKKNEPEEENRDARELAEAVADWRDEDSDRRDFGAEKFDYMNKRLPYEAKDGPFESLEELLLVEGMTPKIYRAVEPYLTVYGKGAVNIHTASEGVLVALGLSSMGANVVLGYRHGPDGKEGTEDDQVFSTLPFFASEISRQASAEDAAVIARLIRKSRIGVGSDVYSFTVSSQPQEDAPLSRAFCVINREGQILVWRENAGIDLTGMNT